MVSRPRFPLPGRGRRSGVLLLGSLFALFGCAEGDAGRAEAPSRGDALPLCETLADPEPGSCRFSTTGFYTTKEPYRPLQDAATYEVVPEGFRVVSVQHVARHGSRALSGPGDDELTLELWKAARDECALTPLGELLGPVLEDILRVHAEVGYGRASRRGEMEHEEMAARLVGRLPAFFDALEAREERVAIFHSGRDRAEESGEAFVRALVDARPGLEGRVEPARASLETLYFAAAEGSEAFREYRASDPRVLAALGAIEEDPRTEAMARLMLRQLVDEPFLDRLARGAFTFVAPSDPEEQVTSLVEAADALFGLYTIAVGMQDDAEWDFGRFIHPEAAAWFGYLDDASSFYERGPGFDDEQISFAAAEALVMDMVEAVEAVLAGTSAHPLTLRFSHAQALLPLAAWLNIEGAGRGADPEVIYAWETSDWRAEWVAPMGANVQWEVARNDAGETFVRMLHNEREVDFAAPCRPWTEGSRWVRWEELRGCLTPGGGR